MENIVIKWDLLYSKTHKVMDVKIRSIGYEVIEENKGKKQIEVKKDEGLKEKLEKIGADIEYNIASSFLGDTVLVSNDFLWKKHFERNNKNRIVDFKTVFKENWTLLLAKESVFHRIGKGNESNLKFVSPDGHHEVVFKERNGHLIS